VQIIPWLDPREDVSRLLRGSIHGGDGRPVESKGEPLFELLLLVVICGFLVTLLIAGVVHLWQLRFSIGNKIIGAVAPGVRLKQRIRTVPGDLRTPGVESQRSA
jgi:hypothetical protein